MEVRKWSAFFLILLFLISCQKEDEITANGELYATVTNEFKQLLSGALVTLQDGSFQKIVLTSEDGVAVFKEIPTGTYTLSIEKGNYLSQNHSIMIVADSPLNGNYQLIAGENTLELSDSILHVLNSPKSGTVTINSNSSWKVSVLNDWLSSSSSTGSGTMELTISWENNLGDSLRFGKIKIISGDLEKEINILQEPLLKILEIKGIPGNGAREIVDSVSLIFNKEIIVSRIHSKWETCQSDINFNYILNNQGVKFSYACARLGGTYPFIITVQDQKGLELNLLFDVSFFSKQVKVQGSILDYYVEESQNSYWVLTKTPNYLYEMDLTTLEVKNQFKLDAEPNMFSVNEYNRSIYYSLNGDNNLRVIDIMSGSEINHIVFEPDNYDHPQSPDIYPEDIAFTRDGVGIIILGDGSGSRKWKFIDSSKKDFIWFDQEKSQGVGILDMHANYDGTFLFLTARWGSPAITIFDPVSFGFTEYMPPSTSRGGFIRPSRIDNRIFSGQLNKQLIVNPFNGYSSLESYIDYRNGNADFTYQPEESEIIYFIDDDYLHIIDYQTQNTAKLYSIFSKMRGATATTDGKFLIMYNSGLIYEGGTSEFASNIFQFSTDLFR